MSPLHHYFLFHKRNNGQGFKPSKEIPHFSLTSLYPLSFFLYFYGLFFFLVFSQLFGEHLDVDCLDQGLTSTGSFRFEEDLVDNRIPFLQMLQSVETSSPSILPLKEPSFQTLLRLQHLKKHQPWEEGLITGYNMGNISEMETQNQSLDQFDQSCVTHDIVVELHDSSPIKSEAKNGQFLQFPLSTSECNQEEQPSSVGNCCNELGTTDSKPIWVQPQTTSKQTQNSKPIPVTRERRKRKRTRPAKNKEEVETQRMTHIAVERNRRRQMNDHLNVLRSLMPTSYIHRGDQASIVGGAIDFVKELEQLLQSLKVHKRMRKAEDNNPVSSSSSSSSSAAAATMPPSNGMFMSLSQYRIGSTEDGINNNNNNKSNLNNNLGEEVRPENKSKAAEIGVTVIQTHVNLKIQCPRRPGQLLKAIVALENLRLSILHLNITSSQATVLYSFNLKIEDGCNLGTADEIAEAVRQIFRFIDGS